MTKSPTACLRRSSTTDLSPSSAPSRPGRRVLSASWPSSSSWLLVQCLELRPLLLRLLQTSGTTADPHPFHQMHLRERAGDGLRVPDPEVAQSPGARMFANRLGFPIGSIGTAGMERLKTSQNLQVWEFLIIRRVLCSPTSVIRAGRIWLSCEQTGRCSF